MSRETNETVGRVLMCFGVGFLSNSCLFAWVISPQEEWGPFIGKASAVLGVVLVLFAAAALDRASS